MTDAQSELLSFLKSQAAKGRVPSFEEMREWLGLASKSGVARLIAQLEEQGKIRRNHNRARQIEVLPDRGAVKNISTGELIAELVDRGFVAVPKRLLDKVAA